MIRATLVLATLALTIASCQMPLRAEPINPADVIVVDGDTIQVQRQRPKVRLVGFNAPETRNAACSTEADLGAKATNRLRELVRAGKLDFEYVRCSCLESTQGTPNCNWGRNCGTLKASGRDVGAIFAVSFICGTTSCPKTPRPWCHP